MTYNVRGGGERERERETDWLNFYYTRKEVMAQMPVGQPVLDTNYKHLKMIREREREKERGEKNVEYGQQGPFQWEDLKKTTTGTTYWNNRNTNSAISVASVIPSYMSLKTRVSHSFKKGSPAVTWGRKNAFARRSLLNTLFVSLTSWDVRTQRFFMSSVGFVCRYFCESKSWCRVMVLPCLADLYHVTLPSTASGLAYSFPVTQWDRFPFRFSRSRLMFLTFVLIQTPYPGSYTSVSKA